MATINGGITLKTRLIGLVTAGFLALAGIIMLQSERVLEEAILEQVKGQSRLFLEGLSREFGGISGMERGRLEAILDREMSRRGEGYNFSVARLYIYGEDGRLLADTARRYDELKDMAGFHGDVIRDGVSHIGDLAEYGPGGEPYHTDVIIPLNLAGERAALEMEVDLAATMSRIKVIDDDYERAILAVVLIATLVMVLLVWFVIRRGLLRPIHSLSVVTGRIAGGELSSRVEARTRSEMDDLGRSINRMADSIEALFIEQRTTFLQTIQSLARALEARDSYTAGHSERVAEMATRLGRLVGIDDEELELLRHGALMHDLGKIGITDAILDKKGSLVNSEEEAMRSHPLKTAEIMAPLKRFREFAEIAAWHHERWDGKGYPEGLKGEEIPILARIVAIADTWDAMTSDRRYRKGMSPEEALSIMEREREGGQWDPELLGRFIEMMRSGGGGSE